MGFFDVPAPALDWVDSWGGLFLPSWARLLLWGGMAAAVSMGLYLSLSPQARIRRGKDELARARRALDAYEGELQQAWPLIRHLLRTAFRQVGRVGIPAVLASLPLLFMLSWLETAFGYAYPSPQSVVQVRTIPEQFHSQWRQPRTNGGAPHIVVSDTNNRVVLDVPMSAPVAVVHKRRWWNVLIGNPVGYLPDRAPVDHVEVTLPRQHHLSFGPDWLRGWQVLFFLSLLAVSLGLKKYLRIA